MDVRWSLFVSIQLSMLLYGLTSSFSTICHEHERFALLEFKKSFFHKTRDSCPYDFNAYREIESWKEFGNCCTWDGIECDMDSGHVIGLKRVRNCLSGSINSSTTLFHLVHLQRLQLSRNDQLNGLIPLEILNLTNLLSLDLSYNGEIKLRKPNLLDLVENLPKLENLSLSFVDISASVPENLARSPSLRSLMLRSCHLQGNFPPTILKMPKLEVLDLSDNDQLLGHLPEVDGGSSLKSLIIYGTNFSGTIPSSLGNLASLNELLLGYYNFVGQIPSSLGNLTQLTKLSLCGNQQIGEIPFWIRNMTQLTELYLSDNQLTGAIPIWIGELSNLQLLELHSNKLIGEIPSSFFNLTQLTILDIGSNQFSGQILPQLTKLSHLSFVDLSFNNFNGSIPSSVARLKHLRHLDLISNNFNGVVRVGLFSMLKNLVALHLSFNKLSLVDGHHKKNANVPKFDSLDLASCNLSSFPTFLQYQERLRWLDLSHNNINGDIPQWFLNMSTENLGMLNLSRNSLTSSSVRSLSFKWKYLRTLDIRDNNLEGPVPIPSEYIQFYLASHNKFSGDLPTQLCNLRGIQALHLSNNNLTGALPQCLKNLSDTLLYLSLHDNNFVGEISSILGNGDCNLKLVDLSSNQFHGPLPRSFSRCYNLEFLNLGSNQIEDIFPSWLGSLRNLRVLILHSNKFHGAIEEPETDDEFPSLHIVDLSSNNFSHCLPSSYFKSWHAMKVPGSNEENYMEEYISSDSHTSEFARYDYTLTIFIKGQKTSYEKIQSHLTFIDLSSNNFSCEIPRAIESLVEVQHLNFSNNNLIGPIPSFLKALKKLQGLDLSQNKLYGKIPQELIELTFLEYFNVSFNDLSGNIPEGRQFGTFEDDSYFGNPKLCGFPLSKKCGDVKILPLPQPQLKDEGEEPLEIDWKIVLLGYGSGLVIGVVIGWRFTIQPPGWIVHRIAQMRRRWER